MSSIQEGGGKREVLSGTGAVGGGAAREAGVLMLEDGSWVPRKAKKEGGKGGHWSDCGALDMMSGV